MKPPRIPKDYQEFLTSEPVEPSQQLSQSVRDHIRQELDPSHLRVFTKLLLVQSFIGTLTLAFCPQFNLSLTNYYHLFDFFHSQFGRQICMALCGGIFLGSGALFASQILSLAEIRKIRQSRLLYYMTLSMFFLSAFMGLGVNIYLEVLAYWLLGAMIFGVINFELSARIRLYFLSAARTT